MAANAAVFFVRCKMSDIILKQTLIMLILMLVGVVCSKSRHYKPAVK